MLRLLATCTLLVAGVSCLPSGNITDRSDISGSISSAKAALVNLPNQAVELVQQKSHSPLLPTLRPFGREEAKLESESPLSKKESIYGQAQQFVSGIFHPKPIVDTISESEKYGNSGDKFRKFNDLIVNGYEGFSNFLNAAVDIPFEAMKQLTRKVSAFFGELGAKAVGL